MGAIVLLVMSFGFFNQRFIAPFVTPSRVLSSTPLIVDDNAAVGEDPKIIIPKINVDIPTVYDEESINEAAVQRALEDGILHYPTTPEPGQVGNSVFFGHSSNNILNRGKYKFAFVLLNRLEPGDTFMLEKDGTRYVYRVYDTKIVPPTDLSVLDPDPGRESIATLITCDPPGTSINRLAVFGEQISPSPADNTENTLPPPSVNPQPEVLPSNAPSLWQRITGSIN
jgi:sortase A